ncbi:MAG: HD domain-containing protein [Candidatus Omnitrophica bacterium]|nr:HD domain-containing protein [Candidatus Omnitrophota bacterium]
MKVDFKKELELASRGMIMIHDPKLLINLIIRMLVNKLQIKHAAMLLFDPEKNSYVLNISRGLLGVKIPKGFARFAFDSPIIKIFSVKEYRPLTSDRNAVVADDITRLIWREAVFQNGHSAEIKSLLHEVSEQMQMLNTTTCVPAYYQDKLLAVLLLGEKINGEGFEQEELDFFAALASDAAMAIRNAQLFESLKSEADKNHQLFLQTIIVLSSAIEAKDKYTHGHTERVTKYASAIAHQMVNNGTVRFPETFFDNLYIASLLHDIGKIGAPELILNKPGILTKEEHDIMKQHTVRGSELIKPLNLHHEVVDGILYHHERYDGTGYPEGLKGDEIPVSAAIISVADSYDAMTTDRPYRRALNESKAVHEIELNSSTQFNPKAAKAIVELIKRGKL